MIQWKSMNSIDDVRGAIAQSKNTPTVIFKHSTRCPVSDLAKLRLEEHWDFESDSLDIYYLDLIANRDVSNFIAEELQVHHESPQIILLDKEEVKYDASHLEISVAELKEALAY